VRACVCVCVCMYVCVHACMRMCVCACVCMLLHQMSTGCDAGRANVGFCFSFPVILLIFSSKLFLSILSEILLHLSSGAVIT
jgi:hypothetical protein